MTSRLLISALLGIGLSSSAMAQSLTAPAGIPAATAPGGVHGRMTLADPQTVPAGRGAAIDADGQPRTTGAIGHRRDPHLGR